LVDGNIQANEQRSHDSFIMAIMTDKPTEQGSAQGVSLNGAQHEASAPTSKPGSSGAPSTAPARGIQVTDRALAKIKAAMAREGISPEQGGLRLGVQGGGCSGLTYNIRFDSQPRERDRIFQFGEVRVFVDPKSFIYLHGMTLDYQETLMQQSFVFVNPNASKSCGCGTSFS
jgi:iron-sulfur cluster assembly protein